MSTTATRERDAKLTELVNTMCQRVPKDKRLTADVVLQLLRSKYISVFPEEYINLRREFITNMLDSFYNVNKDNGKGDKTGRDKGDNDEKTGDDDDDDDDDDEEEEEEEDSEGDEDEEEENGEEEEDDEFEEDSDSESGTGSSHKGDDGASDSGKEKPTKRPRTEECNDDDDGTTQRCRAMASCLKYLSHRLRPRGDSETPKEYLEKYLIPQFREKGLDPEKYSKEDARRYRARREVELLQSDGADLNLDRTQRNGRGVTYFTKDEKVPVKTSKFLDDE
ncbi:hypothetical protein, conserved [Trypanosoma brucei gambiense DAL972]|uniref:Uncharacterized protein n=2 Tax=Trypanosoma brucei TaxID=5691 RepID=C9ZY91_TRYB9|nr:hypothetical protein, conserved [Trypanosoma brucei gambiense DAL972]RHW70334.1 hypothetical protein DPX39_090045300 [Trypanosoma brucei equiperdum]CBH14390.1 hypothetical protein, conserved [Trypanosoma brucei gambiense DAL972]|eukprot:XP_011776656.1 hypothetical protein, conserved [Trypanosoma brucei gambiense DAL972]